jgi:hypothetical protein
LLEKGEKLTMAATAVVAVEVEVEVFYHCRLVKFHGVAR